MQLWLEAFQYGFVQRALLAGSLVAVCCACLGIFLVLRKLSLIGEGLAHFSFGVIGLALLLNIYPMYITVPLVLVASLGILYLSEHANVFGDAAIGLVAAVGVAVGVVLASKGGGFNVDLFSYLFGDILAVTALEALSAAALSLVVLALVFLFYHELFAVTFDEEYARVMGIKTRRINRLLVMLSALTIVLGIKVVGIMLVSSLIIFPSLTALQFQSGFRAALFTACTVAVFSVVAGIVAAFILDVPAGAAIVLLNFLLFMLAMAWRAVRRA
ncbi:metal ABC transporter permease [candidate division FCPU426 bacterium]|nr:metal ABC transporter permease [candidate division FCPU426 bacterium]